MTSVSACHIIIQIPIQPVGSGRPQRESNPGPPQQESRALYRMSYRLPPPPVFLAPRKKYNLYTCILESLTDSGYLEDNSLISVMKSRTPTPLPRLFDSQTNFVVLALFSATIILTRRKENINANKQKTDFQILQRLSDLHYLFNATNEIIYAGFSLFFFQKYWRKHMNLWLNGCLK